MEQIGTVLLAGLGAFLATFAAKAVEGWVNRGQASEAQRDIDLQDLIAAARNLGELSEKFWTKSADELGHEHYVLTSHMVAQQHNIAELISGLFTGENKWNCDVQVHRLFTAATGGDFGEPDRLAEPGRLTAILIEVHGLAHIAKSARRKIKRHFLA